MSTHDPVNHPSHYTQGGIECIDAIEAWQLGFHLGNVVKYVVRSAHKGSELQDLQKARFYLDRAIRNLENESQPEKSESLSSSTPCAAQRWPPSA